ncbi:MAG TPA: glucosidase [bacterium]|nr:glucosidase [bacterium]
MSDPTPLDPESKRLEEATRGAKHWKHWGPYLSQRQWGTVREDYSADGEAWDYFPHDHARSRAYRWGEDGLLGLCDYQGLLCFAPALWNGKDPFLKERLFGLSGKEGNHGEDVKECYYFLANTPTHSYMKALYKYPQAPFPYGRLVAENGRRSRQEPEFELADTGVFDGNRYFDLFVEYAKADWEDILIRFTVLNRGPEEARLELLPSLWFRNTWSWGRKGEGYWGKPLLRPAGGGVEAVHEKVGRMLLYAEGDPQVLFTDNETNLERLYGVPNKNPFVKDAFHAAVAQGQFQGLNPLGGTKAAFRYSLNLPAGESRVVRLRFSRSALKEPFGGAFEGVFDRRQAEAEVFYDSKLPGMAAEPRRVAEQAYAGLLWSKQRYDYVVREWLEGDPDQPAPPDGRGAIRNGGWGHFGAEDVLSMPDTWEYPWFAAWDLAFHAVALAPLDPHLAQSQLILLMREWYMHPNGQLPAYEYNFSDVNPPLHAWACWEVYKRSGPPGKRDRVFLSRTFQKLLLNFTWWVNRKDVNGNNLFSGGFLGLDNIGVFDRSKLPPGALEQADATAWMAFYCVLLLSMALELSVEDPAFEDIATKFFEHFISIADAMNSLGGTGLWDEGDGFYYDQMRYQGAALPLKVRSAVGLIPLFAVEVLEEEKLQRLPEFYKRMKWFLENRPDLSRISTCLVPGSPGGKDYRLLAIPTRERLQRVLRYVLNEAEFLSPYGVRSLSRFHRDHPYRLELGGISNQVDYEPGESQTWLFGGNSNWRGPVWFPLNFLLIGALERYHQFYGDGFKVECPEGSGRFLDLLETAEFLKGKLLGLFLADETGARPCHGGEGRYARDPNWKDLVLFHEYFHGDNGKGLGASHQTGWTSLVAELLRRKDG